MHGKLPYAAMHKAYLMVAGLWAVLSGPLLCQETADTAVFPAGFRPFVHLIDAAEVVAPASGPNWRAMDIKAYDQNRKKYMELEAMVLKVWPQVQILTVMMDTLRPAFLAGIASVPQDTLAAQRKAIKADQQVQKAEKKAEKKADRLARKSDASKDVGADEGDAASDDVTLSLGGDGTTGPDTLRIADNDCMVAFQQQQGYLDLDSLDAEGKHLMLQDTAYDGDLGIKEGFLLVHLLDRQNPGMLGFADDYAKAVKLPYWGAIKTLSRFTGYRLNKVYDPERYDGRLEHIIRKHGLDLLDPPCHVN